MPLKELCGIFPNLNASNQTITSPIDPNYNCVAWATGDTRHWWEPFGLILPAPSPPYYWPNDIPQNNLPDTYIALFGTHGFQITNDSSSEAGIDKLAIYTHNGEFRHIARQLPNGRWTSKIGGTEDIEHELRDLESDGPFSYGKANIFMQKRT